MTKIQEIKKEYQLSHINKTPISVAYCACSNCGKDNECYKGFCIICLSEEEG